jgi:hypothetical protein
MEDEGNLPKSCAAESWKFSYEMTKSPHAVWGLTYLLADDSFCFKATRESNIDHEAPREENLVFGQRDPQRIFVFAPRTKTYTEIPLQDPFVEVHLATEGKPFEPSRETRKIGGQKCEVVVRKSGNEREEACVSAELGHLYKKLQGVLPKDVKSAGARLPKELPGFPLEWSYASIHLKLREVAEPKKHSFALTVPAGYEYVAPPFKSGEDALRRWLQQFAD